MMQRDISQLGGGEFDLAVVGGGIHGAWAALDGAQRGLRVCLVEQGDFGAATSGNSQRIIHGGLRYLQHADLQRFRQSVRERRILLQSAPELVRPMPVLAPTMRRGLQSRAVMYAAMKANDLLSLDRNRDLPAEQGIRPGRLVSREECRRLAPGIEFGEFSGGALFWDAQLLSSERHIISIVRASAAAGVVVANYVQAEGFLQRRGRAVGVRARDVLNGDEVEVRARVVLNCAGPWTGERVKELGASCGDSRLGMIKAAVLLTRGLGLQAAVAMPERAPHVDPTGVLRKRHRNYFLTPWRGLTLVGTFYSEHTGPAGDCGASREEIDSWLREVNAACPGIKLAREDVRHVYAGLLPRGPAGELQYARRHLVLDHEHAHGIAGVVSVVGVKYTTARAVAEEAVSLICRKLGREPGVCRTAAGVPFKGQRPEENAELAAQALCDDESLLRVLVRRAVREEMACTLGDVALRRTDLASAGYPGDEALARCASAMGELLSWDSLRIQREIAGVRRLYEQWGRLPALPRRRVGDAVPARGASEAPAMKAAVEREMIKTP